MENKSIFMAFQFYKVKLKISINTIWKGFIDRRSLNPQINFS